MDRRQLFKANNSVLSPKNCKRKVANSFRSNKRSELYTSTRNISLSPSPKKRENANEFKENFAPPLAVPSKPDIGIIKEEQIPRQDLVPSKLCEKISRQKAHLMKFLAWKAEKNKQNQQKQVSKRAPFVVPTRCANGSSNLKNSFAPKNHVFIPPANIQDLDVQVVGTNSIRCTNGEQEATYHFVATPKKKNIFEFKSTIQKPLSARPAPKAVISKSIAHKTPVAIQKVETKVTTIEVKPTAPTSSTKKIPSILPRNTPNAGLIHKPQSHQKLPQKSVKTVTNPIKTPAQPKIVQAPSKTSAKVPNSIPTKTKMPPPSQPLAKPNSKPTVLTRSTFPKSTIPKAEVPPIKRPTFKASKKAGTSISNAFLSVNRNQNKKASNIPPKVILKGKAIENGSKITKPSDPILETPTDLNPLNCYPNFVTSTKRKSSSSKDLGADLMFVDLGKIISPVEDCVPSKPTEPNEKTKVDNKFNFVRYSVVPSEKDNAAKPTEEKTKEVAKEQNKEVYVTPDRATEPPPAYMSPYVSVSRGKVGLKTEKEKRNSIYLSSDNSAPDTPEATKVLRRTLATVHYHRNLLNDEIKRLNDQCDAWEQYKSENANSIEDSGMDMINVTIGQTKLLTSKKLKQFGDLIDRCEDNVLEKKSKYEAGSEAARPILPEDLEGFWSMVKLQIENVDKRFINLERWKGNNWNDPDEVAPKETKTNVNGKKLKKRKPVNTARPNSALQKMLKAAHASYLNKKTCGGIDEDVILTPSKTRQVVIKDRRSRSAAATVITVNTPRTSRKSMTPTEPKQLPHINSFRKSINLLKNTLLSEKERKSPATDCETPLKNPSVFRKSILKTPGSKCRPKSVIFNSPPIKFTIEDTLDEPNKQTKEELQQEEEQRTYKLRNRRIVLRDSAEFVIPK